MRRRLRRVSTAVVLALALSGIAVAAYAYGIQWHTVNSFHHGCNADPGCYGSTNKAGDYNKEGQTWHGSRAIQQSINMQVWDAQFSSQKVNSSCSNCWYKDIAYDTNPRWECDFKTWHSVWNGSQVLNGHFHWTEAATSSAGC